MNPLISVIVPVYKVETYLPKCLDSIVNQTYKNLEIILVDDGSPDNCPAMCDEWAEKDDRILVIHQTNGGISAARNAGLEKMQGQYLLFVDSDDWIAPDTIACLYERIVRDHSDMAMGHTVKVYPDGTTELAYATWSKNQVITGTTAIADLGKEQTLSCTVWGKLLKRSVYEKLRFPIIRRAEDLWIFPEILDRCDKISLENSVFYYYYQRSNSIMHASSQEQWKDSAAAAFHVSGFLIDRNLWENAAIYCLNGLGQLQNVQDMKAARKLLKDTYTRKDWNTLVRYRKRCLLCATYLYLPGIFKALQRIWHKIRG